MKFSHVQKSKNEYRLFIYLVYLYLFINLYLRLLNLFVMYNIVCLCFVYGMVYMDSCPTGIRVDKKSPLYIHLDTRRLGRHLNSNTLLHDVVQVAQVFQMAVFLCK